MKKFLLGIVYLLLACNIDGNGKERSTPNPVPTIVPSRTPAPVPPGVRKEILNALIEQVLNDPVVHLKYWHWGGHSPDDLAEYIWIQYRKTKWKVTIQEAQVLKSRAIEILDEIYKKKAEKKFKKNFLKESI